MSNDDFLKAIVAREKLIKEIQDYNPPVWGNFNNNIATTASLTIDKSLIEVATEANLVVAELADGTTKVLKNRFSGELKGYSIISDERLEELAEAEEKLAALEAAGVDNWDGYEIAMADIYEQVKEF